MDPIFFKIDNGIISCQCFLIQLSMLFSTVPLAAPEGLLASIPQWDQALQNWTPR